MNDCFSSTGKDETVERTLESFHSIYVTNQFDLVLTQDTSHTEKVRITGGKNVLEGVSTKIENGQLKIENCNKCNFVRSYDRKITVEVFIKSIDDIFCEGASSISCSDTLSLSKLKLYHTALNDVNLLVNTDGEINVESINSGATIIAGRAFKLSGSIEEISELDARNLICDEVIFDNHSPLDSYINATKIIYVGIYGNGNVYYVKEPSEVLAVKEARRNGRLLLLK